MKVETRLAEINGEKIIESGDCCANKKINLNLNVHRGNSFDLKKNKNLGMQCVLSTSKILY